MNSLPRILRRIPVPFWCYFLPMLASAAGWIPRSHPAYPLLSEQLLPICLVFLLLGTDLASMAALGRKALLVMLAGSAGTVIGALVSFSLYRAWLPAGAWGAVGALSASWIGGSANLLAIKEALQVPDSLIGPIVVVDAAVAYSWMALLIASAGLQEKWVWRGVMPETDEETARRTSHESGASRSARNLALGIGLGLAVSWAAQSLAQRLPPVGRVITAPTWTVLLVTTFALLLSGTAARTLGQGALPRLGTLALYVLLASIGARADLTAVTAAPVFLALGVTWIAIHGAVLLLAGCLLRAPLGLIATASQANIGGTISAPIVGATFSPRLATAGLLMAIFGNILGTYLGLLTALLLRQL